MLNLPEVFRISGNSQCQSVYEKLGSVSCLIVSFSEIIVPFHPFRIDNVALEAAGQISPGVLAFDVYQLSCNIGMLTIVSVLPPILKKVIEFPR